MTEPDLYELLEQLRLKLNESKIEQMEYFHTHSAFKKECSYYVKSKMLYDRFEAQDIKALILQISSLLVEPTDTK